MIPDAEWLVAAHRDDLLGHAEHTRLLRSLRAETRKRRSRSPERVRLVRSTRTTHHGWRAGRSSWSLSRKLGLVVRAGFVQSEHEEVAAEPHHQPLADSR